MAANFARAIRSFSEIPGPTLLPLIGNSYQYTFGTFDRFAYHDALKALYTQYGPVVKENLGGKVIVHVFEPEDIKTVYSHETKWPIIPPLQETTEIYRAQKDMSLGLGNTNGEEWYRLRSNSQQRMLRPKEVSHHLPAVNRTAQEFVRRIDRLKYLNSEVNDLRLEVGRWSLENAANIVFEKKIGCLESGTSEEEFGRQMVEANATIFKLSGILKLSLPFYRYITTPKWRSLVNAEDFFYGHAIKFVDEAILQMKDALENNSLREDQFYILSYLISKEQLSLKDVTIICLSLFSDGLSTTTPTVLFNLYSLASNQAVQQKVYEEITAVVKEGEQITTAHIAKMPYLKAFVKETFRVWPNGTEISRYTEADMTLSGYHIPKGTHVDLNPLVHFRNPDLFPDPDVHSPDRWIDNRDEKKIHPYLLTPFGHGTRMCAGRRFAEQDLYVLLSTILLKYKLEYPVGERMGQKYNTLLFPDRPVRIKFIPRS